MREEDIKGMQTFLDVLRIRPLSPALCKIERRLIIEHTQNEHGGASLKAGAVQEEDPSWQTSRICRQGRSAIDPDVELVKKNLEVGEDSQNTLGVFCDLSNAFNCENHETLIRKLPHSEVTGRALDVLISYLTNRIQRVHEIVWIRCPDGGATGIDPRCRNGASAKATSRIVKFTYSSVFSQVTDIESVITQHRGHLFANTSVHRIRQPCTEFA
ncbi:hypothetical protein EVAR_40567_1 [Eumeta japonica]|uniref:Reverse transcriptase domain-containing protein n=1 Tax=Eumeta variegata TaxID=151549 RepID=A0A4C1VZ62_EUMVA|nr:hypothetical protein EVAR_40567_1 [Eumeta japonica]